MPLKLRKDSDELRQEKKRGDGSRWLDAVRAVERESELGDGQRGLASHKRRTELNELTQLSI